MAVTEGKIGPLAVTNDKIANGTITEAKLATAVQTKLNTLAGGVPNNSIGSIHIINGSILGTDICDNTIGIEKIEPQVSDRLITLENPTGLITIVSSSFSTTWFQFEALYKDKLGGYNSFYNAVNKINAGMTHHFVYTSNKFLYGDNPILRIKITNATPTNYTLHQGASLKTDYPVTGAYHYEFEDIFSGGVKNMVFEVAV